MSGKRYIVTGGAGFIGSHVVDLLLSEGHGVTVLDNLSTGDRANTDPRADFVECDLATGPDLAALLRGADGVFHLAALPRIQPSFDEPIEHDDANLRATLRLLRAMKEAGVPTLVYSGTSAVYGDPAVVPTPETCPIQVLNPYALQKYAAEQYARLLGPRLGIRAVTLRYFNAYGPRSFNPKNRLNAYSSVIGIFHHLARTGAPIEVTGTGEQRRDFVHVFDIARANLLAMVRGAPGEAYNVGTGRTHSVLEVARLFTDRWRHGPARPGEAGITHADTTKIRRDLGWSPAITLEQAIADRLL